MKMRTVFVAMSLLTLAACGGGGGAAAPASSGSQPSATASAPAAPSSSNSNSTPPANAGDVALADRLYKGDARTPAGFDVESRPSNVFGTLSTRHIKNTDLISGTQSANTPTFEVCSNDLAQVIDWSERQATWNGQYSDLVEVRSDARMFEIVRVPRADVTAMLRHRVFRCDYLDRSTTDLRTDIGAAGSMNQRPLNANELEALAEYLWQFTMYNNSDFAVESSTRSMNGGALVQTIRLGQMTRGSGGACDTVQLMDWTHTMSATDGAITRALSNTRSYRVKSTGGVTEMCAG